MKQLKQKVLLITNMISPYRIPLFNIISEKGDFNFKVIALAEREKNREWEFGKNKIKFDYQILPGWHWFIWGKKREVAIHFNRGVFKMLLEGSPDIVITSGYDSLAYWQAFLYCKIYKKKFILWNGTTIFSSGSVQGIRGMLKRIIIRGADKYIAYGTKSKEYLEYFGAKTDDIYITTNSVDMDYFKLEVNKYRNNNFLNKKREGYPEILLLYVGQLIFRKGVLNVLKALKELNDNRIGFLIVGNGPEEKDLKQYCRDNNLKNIYFEGFKQQEELPEYYALADIFILPSFEEVWGLVVNEALASGLYVLSSKYAGVSYDLIKEGWNGEIFDPYDINKITSLIKNVRNNILEIRKKREEISKWACEYFSINKSAEAFITCIQGIYRLKNNE